MCWRPQGLVSFFFSVGVPVQRWTYHHHQLWPEGYPRQAVPEIGALADEVAQAREATRAAAEATEMAARQSRAAAQHLRAAGYSVSDSAVIMGVSRGRVSQLVNL